MRAHATTTSDEPAEVLDPPDSLVDAWVHRRTSGRPVLQTLFALLVLFAGLAVVDLVLVNPMSPVDESAHVSYAFQVNDGVLPTVETPQSGGGLHYAPDRTIFTAQHPPLMASLTGPLLEIGRALEWRRGAVFLARLVALFSGLALVTVTVGLLSELFPRQPARWIFPAAVTLCAGYIVHLSSIVYTDIPAAAAVVGALWAGFRVQRLGANGWRITALSAGLTTAAGLRLSAFVTAGVAVAVAVLGIALRDRGRRARDQIHRVVRWAALPPLVLFGWFYARNVWLYGDVTGGERLFELLGREPGNWTGVLRPFYADYVSSGYLTARTYPYDRPDWLASLSELVVRGWILALLALLVARARSSRRNPTRLPTERRNALLLVLGAGLSTYVLLLVGIASHVAGGGHAHARYWLAIVWIVAVVISWLAGPTSRPIAYLLVATVVVEVWITFAVNDLRIAGRGSYRAAGDDPVSRLWSMLSVLEIGAAVALVVGLALAAVGLVWFTKSSMRLVVASSTP